jgi:HD-GYP domain-containing protein (c-di-GMP phosphodiesterase class II)
MLHAPSSNPASLVPLAIKTLCAPVVLDFELYIQHRSGAAPLLYHERGHTIEQGEVERLIEGGVRTLFVTAADAVKYGVYLREVVLCDERLSPVRRYEILRHAAQEPFVRALAGGDIDQVFETTRDLSEQTVKLLRGREVPTRDLFAVMTHDESTYAHLANVCAYTILLAERLGVRDARRLGQIGQGALLHDLGKQYVPVEILNKGERLTPRERAILRRHPLRGFEELCRRDDIGFEQLMMVYQHHETLDGRGYPVGLCGDDIHDWSRICAIANAFDAFTRDGPYRKATPDGEALEHLEQQAGTLFDEEMTRCWISMIDTR